MIATLLILIPLLSGIIAFFLPEKMAKTWALFISLITLVVSLAGLTFLNDPANLRFTADWLPGLGSTFAIKLDGMGQTLCLLTAITFPITFIATWQRKYTNENRFYALMLLSQTGLMGVFMAMDALVFYFFWELALIPVYFLCSIWGGERRVAATFKFFIYTFVGSLLMLIGLIYIQSLTPDKSFSIESFYNANIPRNIQGLLFWLLFIAFAVKMPIFPFHTWQPDTYEQSNTATTIVLSAVMVKMGVFAVIRWLLPVLPVASYSYGETSASFLAVIGMVYASLLAMKQDDIKRLIAYSSMAHVGLMCIAIFAESNVGLQGVMFQMFAHGISITGLWIIVEIIERRYGTRKLSEMGGLAQKAPALSIALVILALANVALPLTNAFIGEFLMFNGIFSSPVFRYEIFLVVGAGLTIILSVIYTLRMVQKVLYGNTSPLTSMASDLVFNEKFALAILVLLVVLTGIYPQPLLDITSSTTEFILREADITHLLRK